MKQARKHRKRAQNNKKGQKQWALTATFTLFNQTNLNAFYLRKIPNAHPPIHSFIAEFMRLGNTDTWHLSRALWALKRTVFESYPRGSSSECAVV